MVYSKAKLKSYGNDTSPWVFASEQLG